MVKSLQERIADRVNKEPPVKRASGRVAFLSLKDEVRQAVRSGWPVKEIWKTLYIEGRISVGYHTFNLYVNKYIRDVEVARLLPDKPGIPNKPDKPNPPVKVGFTINSSPKKEDII
jgi:hypothetical protein